jgi:hypothetical protein
MTAELFDKSKPDSVERLARIEGQSNFLAMLANVEAGPDTTQDMGALAFSRGRCRPGQCPAIPEALEAYAAQTEMFKLPLMSIVWRAVLTEFKPKRSDWPWVQGAVADAFTLMRLGYCKPYKIRARQFKVDDRAYNAMRNLASGVFGEILDAAENEWKRARFSTRGITSEEHNPDVGDGNFSRGDGNFLARPLPTDVSGETPALDTRGLGMADRLSWDDRNSVAGPVRDITNLLLAQPTGADAIAGGESPSQNRPADDWAANVA